MSDPIPLPNLEFPGMVDKTGGCSTPLGDFLRAMHAELTDLAATVAASAASSTPASSENSGDDLLAAMYGTRGVDIFGSVASGVEIRGPDLTGITAQQGPPGRDGEEVDTWPMPGIRGERGERGGTSLVMVDADEQGEPWPMLPPVDAYAEYTARSLAIGAKTIPAGYGLYVIGPYEISAGAILEIAAGGAMEVG